MRRVPPPKIFRCECYGEGIAVDAVDNQVFMAYWQLGHRQPTSIGMRIRHIIQVLKEGHPHTDMVVLSPEEAEALGNHLIGEASRLRLERAIKEKKAANGDCEGIQ